MLKEVMLGSGGIMLAAAIFASSVNIGQTPADTAGSAPDNAPPVVTPPPAELVVVPPPAAMPEENGDTQFGAPMISTTPVAAEVAEPQPIITDPDSAVANGGRQYKAKDTPHHYPIPK